MLNFYSFMLRFYDFTLSFYSRVLDINSWVLRFYKEMIKFYDIMLEFNENVIVKFYDDLISVLVEWMTLIPQLISLLNKDSGQEGSDDNPSENPDELGSGPGPDGDDSEPDGDDSEPEDNDSKKKKLDKGKGKAIETTPELTPEQTQEYGEFEEKTFQSDLEKARLESLRANKIGESSAEGAKFGERENARANLDFLKKFEQGESLKGDANLESHFNETQEQDDTEYTVGRYYTTMDLRRERAKEFNDITMKLNEEKSSISPQEREDLVNKSVGLRSEVNQYDKYLDHLREVLNIQPENESNSQDNSEDNSEDYSSEYSSEEESRSAKRPKR